MFKADDTGFEDHVIERVETMATGGYTIQREDGWSFQVPKNPAAVPKVGSTVRFYGKGVGSVVRGLDVDGVEIWYKTAEQQEAENREWVENETRRKDKEYEEQKAGLFQRIALLPEHLQKRIQRFLDNNHDFGIDYLAYELFCCEQAVVIAAAFKDVESLRTWANMDFNEQRKIVPALSDDHSGNTFGCSKVLALDIITTNHQPRHGAMCPLVGCVDYGCVLRA